MNEEFIQLKRLKGKYINTYFYRNEQRSRLMAENARRFWKGESMAYIVKKPEIWPGQRT